MLHELKTWPEFFQETLDGRKQFELRRNDRDFKVGDELLLREWDPQERFAVADNGYTREVVSASRYTGRELLVRVDYIMPAETLEILVHGSNQRFFTDNPPQFVIMSISKI